MDDRQAVTLNKTLVDIHAQLTMIVKELREISHQMKTQNQSQK